jgi:hypothetical protein
VNFCQTIRRYNPVDGTLYDSVIHYLRSTELWCESQKEKGRCEDSDVDRRIILKWIKEIWGWYGLDSSGLGQRPVAGFRERGSELSGSMKFQEILE